jgi:phage FluMu protein Com
MKEIMVSEFELYDSLLSVLITDSPTIKMTCGSCGYPFIKMFKRVDFKEGYPKTVCPNCIVVNFVPIKKR